jgi:hypothetical protein
VRAAATAGPPAPPPVLEIGDRVRHDKFGEMSVLEAKPHALLLRADDGGKEIWVGRNSRGGGQVEVLDGSGATIGAPPPKLPDFNHLPRGTFQNLKYEHPLPASCAAGSCECFGRANYYGEAVGVCSQPSRLKGLQTRLKAARTAENKRRHAQAVEMLVEAIDSSVRIGSRELAVLGHALADRSGYRPNGTSWAEMWKLASIDTQVLKPSTGFEDLVDVDDPSALARALVKAVLFQDLALRFHPDGGRSYGWLAEQYIGQPIPQACAEDWSPDEKGDVP